MGESTEGMVTDESTYKSTFEITKGLASAYATMNDIDRAALLELVAGGHICRNV